MSCGVSHPGLGDPLAAGAVGGEILTVWGHILARLCWGQLGRRRRNPQLRQCPVRQIPAVVVRQGGHILLGQDALIEVCCHKGGS